MTNNKRTKRLPRIILNQFLVGLLMCGIAVSVLFFADGYRFNYKNFKIIKTGILYLSSDPKDAAIHVNGKLVEKKTPFADNLTPGNYNAKVEKNGYYAWSASFKIESGLVASYDSIILFKLNPEVSNLSDQGKIDLLNSPIDYLANSSKKNSLLSNGNEIWQNNNLVTRYSEPVNNISWYPDQKHILFQQGDEIRVIEISGMNDTLLVKLNSSDPARYVVSGRGDEVYYLDGSQYKMAKIR